MSLRGRDRQTLVCPTRPSSSSARGLLKAVAVGQILATIHPPGEGVAGFRIDGEAVPARGGAEAKLKLGAGAALEDAGIVRATRAGVVLYKPPDSLDVVSEHVHQGAIDLRSGHLDMQNLPPHSSAHVRSCEKNVHE